MSVTPVVDDLEARTLALKGAAVFSEWPDESLKFLAGMSRLEAVEAQVAIQSVGQLLHSVHVLVSGTTQSGVTDTEGRRVSLKLHQPGDVHGLFLWATGKRVQRHDLVTLTPSTFLVIPLQALDQAAEADPSLWRSIAAESARRLLEVLEMALSFGLETPRARFARHILRQVESTPAQGDGTSLMVAISQQVLADLVGVSRPTVVTLARDFEERGLIKRHYGHIEVLDLQGLSQMSQFVWGREAPR